MANDVSMKRKRSTDTLKVIPDSDYSHGPTICLKGDDLDLLGIKALPAVDTEFEISGRARVVSISEDAEGAVFGANRSVTLQIERLGLADPDADFQAGFERGPKRSQGY